ncbi:hypothetical protein GJ496_004979 [Pomphorhynchus laevis]|nr:hypothetical protein GJ496_004979 [Pomphorhynchus laevis]
MVRNYHVGRPNIKARPTINRDDNLYRLIIGQLLYDGFQQVAMQLTTALQISPLCQPSERLIHLISSAIQQEEDTGRTSANDQNALGLDFDYLPIHNNGNTRQHNTVGAYKSDSIQRLSGDGSSAPEGALYETCYVTAHKGPCRTATFDQSGSVIATGSVDASIKILDVDRLLAKSSVPMDVQDAMQQAENHPVVRTLLFTDYDHTDEITHLEFQPREPLLLSGSRDCTLKFFEFSKTTARRSCRVISESNPIRCFSFHPNGEWLLVATEQASPIRLYSVETGQAYVCNRPADQHERQVSSICWTPNAHQFASASKDGTIKIWDGVSNRVISTISDAHGKEEVCSVAFTRNSKYLLSSGKDSIVRLWELTSSRCLMTYTGAGSTGKQLHRTRAFFNHTEDYVFFPDERTVSLCCWNARTGERQQLLSLGHNNVIKCIVHSPVCAAFISCSDDFRARFWCKKPNDL